MDFLMDYNLEKTKEEIAEACQKVEILAGGATSEQKALYLNYLLGLLNIKQQEELLGVQNKFNAEALKANKKLVIATWALAGATILLAIITAIIR